MSFTNYEMEFHIWSLELVTEAERSGLSRHDQKLATLGDSLRASLRENDIRSSIQTLGVTSRCRSKKRRLIWPCCREISEAQSADYAVEVRSNPQLQTRRWLAVFILYDLLIGLLLPLCDLLTGCVNKQTNPQTSDWSSKWAGIVCWLVPQQQLNIS